MRAACVSSVAVVALMLSSLSKYSCVMSTSLPLCRNFHRPFGCDSFVCLLELGTYLLLCIGSFGHIQVVDIWSSDLIPSDKYAP